MVRFLLALALGLTFAWPVVPSEDDASAAKRKLKSFTKTDTVAQSGATSVQAENAAITDPGNPFVFAKVGKIRRLDRIFLTATIDDGSTAPGNQDENQLSLVLDGIDTGLLLNGFGSDLDTRTTGGVPDNAQQILSALKADGELVATIDDATPGNNQLTIPATSDTTLVLKGKQKGKKK
jgi:hypothetical protein